MVTRLRFPQAGVVKFNAGNELRERCGLSEYLREREGSWGNKENVGVDVLEKYSNHPDRHVIGAILENKKCTPERVCKIAGRLRAALIQRIVLPWRHPASRAHLNSLGNFAAITMKACVQRLQSIVQPTCLKYWLWTNQSRLEPY